MSSSLGEVLALVRQLEETDLAKLLQEISVMREKSLSRLAHDDKAKAVYGGLVRTLQEFNADPPPYLSVLCGKRTGPAFRKRVKEVEDLAGKVGKISRAQMDFLSYIAWNSLMLVLQNAGIPATARELLEYKLGLDDAVRDQLPSYLESGMLARLVYGHSKELV